MNWFTPKCAVDPEVEQWLDECMLWLMDEFGVDALESVTVVLPTDEFFPDRFSASEGDLRNLVHRVCGYMNVDPQLVELEFFSDEQGGFARSLNVAEGSHSSALGTYRRRRGRYVISLETSQAANPMNFIATVAHELGHVRLLGEGRLDPEYEEHELMTDLATIFFGMGIFTANSVFAFRQWTNTFSQGWQVERKGYMTEEMFGYALALFACLRGEKKPAWARYLEGSVRDYFKSSLRYLEKNGERKLKTLKKPVPFG